MCIVYAWFMASSCGSVGRAAPADGESASRHARGAHAAARHAQGASAITVRSTARPRTSGHGAQSAHAHAVFTLLGGCSRFVIVACELAARSSNTTVLRRKSRFLTCPAEKKSVACRSSDLRSVLQHHVRLPQPRVQARPVVRVGVVARLDHLDAAGARLGSYPVHDRMPPLALSLLDSHTPHTTNKTLSMHTPSASLRFRTPW